MSGGLYSFHGAHPKETISFLDQCRKLIHLLPLDVRQETVPGELNKLPGVFFDLSLLLAFLSHRLRDKCVSRPLHSDLFDISLNLILQRRASEGLFKLPIELSIYTLINLLILSLNGGKTLSEALKINSK